MYRVSFKCIIRFQFAKGLGTAFMGEPAEKVHHLFAHYNSILGPKLDIKVMQYQVKRANTRGKRFTLVLDIP